MTHLPISSQRDLKRQAHRVQINRLVVFDMLGESAMLGLFAYAGTIPAWIAFAFLLTGPAIATGFYLAAKTGLNLRFRDKDLLIPQIVVQLVLQITFMILAPQLAVLFLLTLLLLSGHAVIRFTARQFTIAWIVYAVVTGIALLVIGDRFSYPGTSSLETALVWMFFVLALRFLTLVSARFGSLRAQLSEKNRQLENSLAQIEMMAQIDHLTGVASRRHFFETLEAEVQRAGRSGQAFSIAMLDLDHFKAINDRYGHPVGDLVLKKFCAIASATLRTIDSMGRLGGEEFAVIMPATGAAQAPVLVERIRQAVAAADWQQVAPELAVTFSAGLATFMPGDTVESLMKDADIALYAAKKAGRNCTLSSARQAGISVPEASTQ